MVTPHCNLLIAAEKERNGFDFKSKQASKEGLGFKRLDDPARVCVVHFLHFFRGSDVRPDLRVLAELLRPSLCLLPAKRNHRRGLRVVLQQLIVVKGVQETLLCGVSAQPSPAQGRTGQWSVRKRTRQGRKHPSVSLSVSLSVNQIHLKSQLSDLNNKRKGRF